MDLIAATGLAIGPRGRVLARDIAFTVGRGQVLALLGPNGAGKSTLIRTLLGLQPAQAGRIDLQGQPLASLTRARIASRAAWVPQSLAPGFPFQLRDFVVMGRLSRLGPFSAPGPEDWAAVDQALARTGIATLARQPVTRLSGGERQLALLARALAQEAPLILLDEPAASLDWGNRQRLDSLLEGLRDAGLGLILATHDPDQARRLADQVLTLDRQGQARRLPPATALSPQALAALYL